MEKEERQQMGQDVKEENRSVLIQEGRLSQLWLLTKGNFCVELPFLLINSNNAALSQPPSHPKPQMPNLKLLWRRREGKGREEIRNEGKKERKEAQLLLKSVTETSFCITELHWCPWPFTRQLFVKNRNCSQKDLSSGSLFATYYIHALKENTLSFQPHYQLNTYNC